MPGTEIATENLYLRARIAWWQNDLPKTGALLDSLLSNPTGESVENEAILLKKVLKEGEKDSLVLQKIARADRFEETGPVDSARAIYRSFAPDSTQPLAAEALWRLIQLDLQTQDTSVVSVLNEFVAVFPLHPRSEEAWLTLGGLWETRGDKEKAIHSYENLLVQYPDGILAPEARLRLDALSGMTLPPLLPAPDLTQ